MGTNSVSYAEDLSRVNIMDQQRAFSALASAIGREYKLRFSLVDTGGGKPVVPHTKPDGTVVLPALRTDSTRADVITFWAGFWHEVGHHDHKVNDIFKLITELKLNTFSIHGMCLNVIDDIRNDFNGIDEYLGKQEAIENGFVNILRRFTDGKVFLREPSGPLHEMACAISLVGWGVAGQRSPTFQSAYEEHMDPANGMVHPRYMEIANKILSNKDIMDRFKTVFDMSAKEEWELAKDIVDLLDIDEPNNGCSSGGSEDDGSTGDDGDGQQQQGQGQGEDSEGNGFSGKEYSMQDQMDAIEMLKDEHSSGKEEGKSAEQQAKDSKDNKEGETGEGKTPGEIEAEKIKRKDEASVVKCPYTDASGLKDHEIGNCNTDMNIDYSDYNKDNKGKSYANESELSVIDMSDPKNPKQLYGTDDSSISYVNSARRHAGSDYYSQGIKDMFKETYPASGRVVNVARKKLQVYLRTRYLKNQRKGKLNGGSLYKLKTSNSKKPSIYKKRINNKQDDCRISILIDNSGSMSGHRQLSAYKACLYLSSLCAALRVPYEIAFFTDLYGTLCHFITKPFNVSVQPGQVIEEQMLLLSELMGCNSDGDYIKIAYDRLVSSGSERRKVLMVVSDGQPAGIRADINEVGLLSDTIKMVENDSNVDVLGIGVQTDYVKEYYSHYKVLNEASELESCVIDLIVDSITSK